ncbi:hypothetical protein DL93DRAFT_2102455 [Clavulina sp. PMI_390]|nr:hypothetical protein DL93DRAFT_2102455 [Clavulina sp. PMI_390]
MSQYRDQVFSMTFHTGDFSQSTLQMHAHEGGYPTHRTSTPTPLQVRRLFKTAELGDIPAPCTKVLSVEENINAMKFFFTLGNGECILEDIAGPLHTAQLWESARLDMHVHASTLRPIYTDDPLASSAASPSKVIVSSPASLVDAVSSTPCSKPWKTQCIQAQTDESDLVLPSVDPVVQWSIIDCSCPTIPLNLLVHLISKHQSLGQAEIVSTESYKEWKGTVLHRFIILELNRLGTSRIWLRLDRRMKQVGKIAFLAASGVTPANDTGTISANKEDLIHSAERETRQLFHNIPTLGDLGTILQVISEELTTYQLWPANCWFFVSLIQQHIGGLNQGVFEAGSIQWGQTAHQIRQRIQERLWSLNHLSARNTDTPVHSNSRPLDCQEMPSVPISPTLVKSLHLLKSVQGRTIPLIEFITMIFADPSDQEFIITAIETFRVSSHQCIDIPDHYFVILEVHHSTKSEKMWLRLERRVASVRRSQSIKTPSSLHPRDTATVSAGRYTLVSGATREHHHAPRSQVNLVSLAEILSSLCDERVEWRLSPHELERRCNKNSAKPCFVRNTHSYCYRGYYGGAIDRMLRAFVTMAAAPQISVI